MWLQLHVLLITLLLVVTRPSSIFGDKTCPPMCQCSKKLTTVNCEGKKLTSVPQRIPDSVEKLYLDHNELRSLDKDGFGSLPNLKKLYLQNNKIAIIKPFTFSGENFKSLDFLDLRNNKVTVIENNTFYKLPKLETLYLVNNEIQKITTAAFNGSYAVAYLYLDDNKLSSIPPLGQVRGLSSLYLQGNGINNATFPWEYAGLLNFKSIGLSNNKIRTLTSSAFISLRQSPVLKLELTRNSIDMISKKAFAPLNNIQSLKLGHNPLTASDLEDAIQGLQGKPLFSLNIANITLGGLLPNTTFMLLRNTSIRSLIMPNNKIQHIPDRGFADLENLLTLDLSASGIFSISDTAFEGLKVLNSLLLNDNQLSNIPRNMPSTLQHLYLNGNQLTEIPNLIFSNLGHLQRLYLGGNKIHMLMERSFDGLFNLQKMHLVSNNIGTLPGNVFSSLARLISLELNKNNLKTIQKNPDLFQSMPSLEYLSMADNDCKSMPIDILNPLKSLQYLHLENNLLGYVMEQDNSGTLFNDLSKLITLDLSNNEIKLIPESSFRSLTSLQNLTLKANKISGWGPHLFTMMKAARNIDLSQNLISVVKETSVKDFQNLITLNLTGNPFACTCDLRWFRDWINTTDVSLLNQKTYTCNSPKAWRGKPLLSFDRTKIDCIVYTLYQIIGAACAAAVLMLLVSVVIYRKRWTVKLNVYKMKRRIKRRIATTKGEYEQLLGDNKTFDAYISCSEDDWTWVKDNLLPEIDSGDYNNVPFGGKFKLYFEPRDAEIGNWNIENIVENMEASRLVIIVMTNNYLPDARYNFEMEFIIQCKYQGSIEDYVIIKHCDVEARHVPKILVKNIKQGGYLEWSDHEDAKKNMILNLQDRLEQKIPNPVVEEV